MIGVSVSECALPGRHLRGQEPVPASPQPRLIPDPAAGTARRPIAPLQPFYVRTIDIKVWSKFKLYCICMSHRIWLAGTSPPRLDSPPGLQDKSSIATPGKLLVPFLTSQKVKMFPGVWETAVAINYRNFDRLFHAAAPPCYEEGSAEGPV